MDGFPSGQRGQTVNLLATPSKVRILLHPLEAKRKSLVHIWAKLFSFYRKFLRIPYKIKNNYRGVCPSEARVLRRKRNMPLKRPAAGGESCKAGFFFINFGKKLKTGQIYVSMERRVLP